MASIANSSLSGSPVKFPASSGFEVKKPTLAKARAMMKDAMAGLFVGPMPVDQFLQEFLPQPVTAPLPSGIPAKLFAGMPQTNLEREMYQPFIDLVHDHGLIPNYQIVNTSDYPDHDIEDRRIKPDPIMYKADVDTSTKITQFGEIELHFEFKVNKSYDPFADPAPTANRLTHQFEAWAQGRSGTRSQPIHYSTEWWKRQHRRFSFTVFIGDPFVRFIRWDRAGAVVSEQFNYRDNSQPLIDFLWRFTHHDDAGRGKDPTVRLATAEEIDRARPHLLEWKPEKERPFIVFKVPDVDGKPRDFIAWGDIAHTGSLTGRCTRAYPVYELTTGKLFFLKDTWRAHDLGKEADILRELQDAGVQYIPPFVCGGDLPGDVTMTDLYIPEDEPEAEGKEEADAEGEDETKTQGEQTAGDPPAHSPESGSALADKITRPDGSWRCGSDWKRITQRFHHRFIVDFIGKHISHVTSSKHLMQVISHAFTAHRQAYESKGKWIHRDVSANNILIDASGNGILNDWDLAKRESELTRARKHERTGTWEFMSCLLLSKHHSIHTIQDDMESFVYVFLYHGLRYFPHSESHRIRLLMKNIFQASETEDNGNTVGGTNKRMLFEGKTYLGTGFRFNSAPLNEWIRLAFTAVRRWLDFIDPPSAVISEDRWDIAGDDSDPPSPPRRKKLLLMDHAAMVSLFSFCLSLPNWPEDDAPVDALPLLESKTGLSTWASSSKRTRGSDTNDIDGHSSTGGSVKRSRTSQSVAASRHISESVHSMTTRARIKRSSASQSSRR